MAIPEVSPAPPAAGGLPPPPYPRFSGQTFEPSAAAFDPATGRVLVLSDHDSALYRDELRAARLALPPGEHRLPEGVQAAKLEGLTRLPSGAFLAVTAFDRPVPGFRRLLRFSCAAAAPVEAVSLAVNDDALAAAIQTASGLPLAGLLALAGGGARSDPGPQAYAVDPATSHVRIHLGRAGLLKFLGHEHRIEAPVAEGRVEVVDGDPGFSSVRVRFEAARLAIIPGSEPAKDVPEVEERMRGPEVLDVARHPEISFRSTSVQRRAQDGARYTLVVGGTLTLRGRSVPVEIPLEVVNEGGRIEARGELSLSLRDLGITPVSMAGVVKVANRFRLELEIRADAAPRP